MFANQSHLIFSASACSDEMDYTMKYAVRYRIMCHEKYSGSFSAMWIFMLVDTDVTAI